MSKLIVAVIGVTGFIGKSVSNKLIADGAIVYGFSRGKPTDDLLNNSNFNWIDLNFHIDPWNLSYHLNGVESVVHCAGHYEASLDDLKIFNEFSRTLAVAAKIAGIKKYILISSIAVYGSKNPFLQEDVCKLTPYGESRLRAEREVSRDLLGSKTKLIVFRIPSVVGVSMSSNVIRSFCCMLRWRIFIYQSQGKTFFACVGIKRLTYLLSWFVISSKTKTSLVQPVDCIPWVNLANLYSLISGKNYIRVALPMFIITALKIFGNQQLIRGLNALSATQRYLDNSQLEELPELPGTIEDIEDVMRNYLSK